MCPLGCYLKEGTYLHACYVNNFDEAYSSLSTFVAFFCTKETKTLAQEVAGHNKTCCLKSMDQDAIERLYYKMPFTHLLQKVNINNIRGQHIITC